VVGAEGQVDIAGIEGSAHSLAAVLDADQIDGFSGGRFRDGMALKVAPSSVHPAVGVPRPLAA